MLKNTKKLVLSFLVLCCFFSHNILADSTIEEQYNQNDTTILTKKENNALLNIQLKELPTNSSDSIRTTKTLIQQIVELKKQTDTLTKEQQLNMFQSASTIMPNIENNELSPYQKTINLYNDSISYLSTHKAPWNTILCFGDSITEGVQTGYCSPWPTSYPYEMYKLLNIPITNGGVGGSSLSTVDNGGDFPMVNRIDEFDSNYDAIFLMGGINDWFYGYRCVVGDANTPNTFSYDFNILCSKIQNKHPNSDVFIIIPLDTECHLGIEPYNDIEEYRNAERLIATQYGFNIIDLPRYQIMSAMDEETRNAFFSDACHPNSEGYEKLAAILAAQALKYIE